MTNQVNQYEHHMAIQEAYQIHDSDEYFKARPQLECGDRRKVFYAGHIRGYQAATKASESEINSLKERVAELELTVKKWQENSVDLEYKCLDKNLQIAELQASNNKLRGALRDMLNGWIYIRETHGDLYGVGWDRSQKKAEKALSSTPTQSLAEHGNEVIERRG